MVLFRWFLTCMLVLGLALPNSGYLASASETAHNNTSAKSSKTISDLSISNEAYFLLPSSAPVEQNTGSSEIEGHDDAGLLPAAMALSSIVVSTIISATPIAAVTRFTAPYTARAPPSYC